MYGMMHPGMPPPGYGMQPPPFHPGMPPGVPPGAPGFMPPRPMMTMPPMPTQQFNLPPAPPAHASKLTTVTPTSALAVGAVPVTSMPVPVVEESKGPEQLPDWLPPNCKQMVSVVLIALPKEEEMSDDEMKTLLSLCGPIGRYDRKRSVVTGKCLDMALVTFCSGLGAMRAMRLLQGVELGRGENKRPLVIKLGSRELSLVEEAEDARKMHVSMGPVMMPSTEAMTTVNVDEEATVLEEIQDSISNFLAGLLATSLNDSKTKQTEKSEPSVAIPAALLDRKSTKEMSEEELFEVSLAAEVEQFRMDQRKRDEVLQKDRNERIRKRVKELKATKTTSSTAETVNKYELPMPSSVPTSSHPLASQLSEQGSEPVNKRVKYESGPVITAAPVLHSTASSSVISAPPTTLPSFGMSVSKPASKSSSSKARPLKQAIFSEEVVKKRELVKIDDEPKETEADRDRRIVESLPTNQSELFEYPIAWDLVDSHQVVTLKLKKWVCGKIEEYLGEEEATLIDFVTGKLKEHASPSVILEELKLVLEDDADIFVTKLWKILAFHSAKLKEENA